MSALMVKEKWDFRFVNQMICDTTDEKFADTLSAISTHHQHIDVIFRDIGFDNSVRMSTSCGKRRFNPVTLKKTTKIA